MGIGNSYFGFVHKIIDYTFFPNRSGWVILVIPLKIKYFVMFWAFTMCLAALRTFSPRALFLWQNGSYRAPWVPQNVYFNLRKMFWVASELLSALSETLSNFIQWNPVFWQSWGGNFEWPKMVFINVRLNFAAL